MIHFDELINSFISHIQRLFHKKGDDAKTEEAPKEE